MNLKIQVFPPQSEPFERVIEKGSIVIGRSRVSDLVINDEFLSRKHARLYHNGSHWMLADLGSQNGSWINGKRVRNDEVAVPMGSILKLSSSTLKIDDASAESATGEATSTDFEPGTDSIFISALEILDKQEGANFDKQDEVKKTIERLKLLNEVHSHLADAPTTDKLLELILDKVFQHLMPQEASIYMRNKEDKVVLAATRSKTRNQKSTLYSKSLIQQVVEDGMAALVYDTQTDERFREAVSMIDYGIRSLIAAPLIGTEKNYGMIVLHSRMAVRQFAQDDLAVLVSLASIASMWLKNLVLTEAQAKRAYLEKELALARRIQVALLPSSLPQIVNYQVLADNKPSEGVSGDLFQIRQRDGKWFFMIADISGKGLSASLLTTSLEALTAHPIDDGLPTDEVAKKVARQLYRRTPPERYATAFLMELNPISGQVFYTNAGHNPSLLIHGSGHIELLAETGTPLGLLPQSDYEKKEVTMESKDILLMYTDGLTEATNANGEEYGLSRLKSICRLAAGHSGEYLAKSLSSDLRRFVGHQPFADDRTFIIIQRTDD